MEVFLLHASCPPSHSQSSRQNRSTASTTWTNICGYTLLPLPAVTAAACLHFTVRYIGFVVIRTDSSATSSNFSPVSHN
ncbi:hypothetical protein IHV41_25755, partial [Escherichia coli]|uniref:hypothetical protein n=1 Tax=Escherichia coli TaxID=562 RepID=UPI001F1578E5